MSMLYIESSLKPGKAIVLDPTATGSADAQNVTGNMLVAMFCEKNIDLSTTDALSAITITANALEQDWIAIQIALKAGQHISFKLHQNSGGAELVIGRADLKLTCK